MLNAVILAKQQFYLKLEVWFALILSTRQKSKDFERVTTSCILATYKYFMKIQIWCGSICSSSKIKCWSLCCIFVFVSNFSSPKKWKMNHGTITKLHTKNTKIRFSSLKKIGNPQTFLLFFWIVVIMMKLLNYKLKYQRVLPSNAIVLESVFWRSNWFLN